MELRSFVNDIYLLFYNFLRNINNKIIFNICWQIKFSGKITGWIHVDDFGLLIFVRSRLQYQHVAVLR